MNKEKKMLVGKNEDLISCHASENLRLIDDGFMVRVFQDISCAEFLIRQILGREDLTVKAVYPCEWNEEKDHPAWECQLFCVNFF